MIYQILIAGYDYQTPYLEEKCAARLYERTQAARKLGQSESLKLIYDHLDVRWHDEDDRPAPDIAELRGNLIFNEKALSAINSIIPNDVELISFESRGESWTITNFLSSKDKYIDQISDEDTLFMAMHDPNPQAVLTFLSTAKLPELFYIQKANHRYFCQDQFKAIVKENNLTGIVITENLITQDYQPVS